MTAQRGGFRGWLAGGVATALLLTTGPGGSPAEASQEGRWDAAIRRAFDQAGLPGQLAVLVAHAESSGNPNAPGPGGERGLFQFDQATWRRRSKRPWAYARDPRANIEAAVQHWKALRRRNPKAEPRDYAAWHNAGEPRWRVLKPEWSTRHPNRTYRRIYAEGR